MWTSWTATSCPTSPSGPQVVKALRPHVSIPFDVHLMIAPVDPYLEAFRGRGRRSHPGPPRSRSASQSHLGHIRQLGAKAGVVFDPSTSPEVIEWMMDDIDIVLVMTVNPGFGGQSFMPSAAWQDRSPAGDDRRLGTGTSSWRWMAG